MMQATMPTNLLTVPQRLLQELDGVTRELDAALAAYERAKAERAQEADDEAMALNVKSRISGS